VDGLILTKEDIAELRATIVRLPVIRINLVQPDEWGTRNVEEIAKYVYEQLGWHTIKHPHPKGWGFSTSSNS
jgi:hypothetical protein